MSDKSMENNNKAAVCGVFAGEFSYSHSVLGEGFYAADLAVERGSGTMDLVPLLVSERLVDVKQSLEGCRAAAWGQFRSYNKREGTKTRLILSLFVKRIVIEPDEQLPGPDNYISLNGYICRPPVYRHTPRGREIADVMVAVNREHDRSDYIPCVVWGRNARYAAGLEPGSRVTMDGRIQSREYTKYLTDTVCEKRIAYEVSVAHFAAEEP